jgi:hypothetical protein
MYFLMLFCAMKMSEEEGRSFPDSCYSLLDWLACVPFFFFCLNRNLESSPAREGKKEAKYKKSIS